jgi:hypothetical protein
MTVAAATAPRTIFRTKVIDIWNLTSGVETAETRASWKETSTRPQKVHPRHAHPQHFTKGALEGRRAQDLAIAEHGTPV